MKNQSILGSSLAQASEQIVFQLAPERVILKSEQVYVVDFFHTWLLRVGNRSKGRLTILCFSGT